MVTGWVERLEGEGCSCSCRQADRQTGRHPNMHTCTFEKGSDTLSNRIGLMPLGVFSASGRALDGLIILPLEGGCTGKLMGLCCVVLCCVAGEYGVNPLAMMMMHPFCFLH